MREAYELALDSPDTSTQNGAVIIDSNGNTLASGINELPRGVAVTADRLTRPKKYLFTEHAERNAIYDLLLGGSGPLGAFEQPEARTMVALWAACADCARGIIQAGITTLVTHSFYIEETVEGGVESLGRKDWGASIGPAFEMLEEAGVEVIFADYTVMSVTDEPLLFSGKPVKF